jgi:hypothetical protein
MKIFTIIFFLTMLSLDVSAQELILRLEVESNSIILGLPFRIKATIQGNKPFVLNGRFGLYCDDYGGIIVTDKSGNRIYFSSGSGPCPQVEEGLFASQGKVQYKKEAEANSVVYLPAGSYNLQVAYHSHGPFLDRYSDSDQQPVTGIWEGELRSNLVSVEVKLPEGEDRNAIVNLGPAFNGTAEDYAMFIPTHRIELLKNYPSSTYTTELILQYVDSPEDLEPQKIKELVDAGLYPRGNVVPDADSPSGFSPTLPPKMRAQWYVEHLPVLINKHPNQARAESAKLALGLSYLVLGNKTEANRVIEEVAKLNTKRGNWARNFIAQIQIQ